MGALVEIFVTGDRDQLAVLSASPDWERQAGADAFAEAEAATNATLAAEGWRSEEIAQRRLDDGLVMASATEDWTWIDELVAAGADLNGRDRWGQTAMHFAGQTSVAAVQALLDRGAHAATRDWQFLSTPVGWTHFFEKFAERDHLLAHAEMELVDLALFGRFEAFDALVGSDPDRIDGDVYAPEAWVHNVMRAHHHGETYPVPGGGRLGDPLRACAQHGDAEGVEQLLRRGSDATRTGIRTGTFELPWLARSALGWALAHGDDRMQAALRAAGARLSPLDRASVAGEGLELGESLDDALFVAALSGRIEHVRSLIAAGAEVNRVCPFDQQMRTPLAVALAHGTGLVGLLLDAGADPDAPALFGTTPRGSAGEDPELLALFS